MFKMVSFLSGSLVVDWDIVDLVLNELDVDVNAVSADVDFTAVVIAVVFVVVVFAFAVSEVARELSDDVGLDVVISGVEAVNGRMGVAV